MQDFKFKTVVILLFVSVILIIQRVEAVLEIRLLKCPCFQMC